MTELTLDVLRNYINILSKTIPDMLSGASPAARLGVYSAASIIYPLALVVLLGLIAVAWVAVFAVRPFTGQTPPDSPSAP
ncbi:MAG: hypothetical protein ACR2NQ_01170 [Thermodesulfobacteriota bacterium]